jgi:hypothetical protein
LQEAQKGAQNRYHRGSCRGHSFGLSMSSFFFSSLLFSLCKTKQNKRQQLLGLDALDALLDGNNNNKLLFFGIFF